MNRIQFLRKSIIGTSLLTLTPTLVLSNNQKRPPQLSQKLVKEFVGAGHNDYETVKGLLEQHKNLIYASFDQGNGDFEDALEAASHVGNKKIANYLIANGARVNIFALAMLGKTSLVTPVLEEYPKLLFSKGAHGYTLLHHAKIGENQELYDYLIKKGLTKNFIKIR